MKKTLLIGIALQCALVMAFTPVRRLDPSLYDPETTITNAPDSAQIVLSAKYVKGRQEVIDALRNGQIILQDELAQALASLASWRERAEAAETRAARLDALRTWLEEQRDAAVLPSTKAIYQAIIDRIDNPPSLGI